MQVERNERKEDRFPKWGVDISLRVEMGKPMVQEG